MESKRLKSQEDRVRGLQDKIDTMEGYMNDWKRQLLDMDTNQKNLITKYNRNTMKLWNELKVVKDQLKASNQRIKELEEQLDMDGNKRRQCPDRSVGFVAAGKGGEEGNNNASLDKENEPKESSLVIVPVGSPHPNKPVEPPVPIPLGPAQIAKMKDLRIVCTRINIEPRSMSAVSIPAILPPPPPPPLAEQVPGSSQSPNNNNNNNNNMSIVPKEKNNTKPYICVICDMLLNTEVEFVNHKRQHDPVFECFLCQNVSFTEEQEFKAHIKEHARAQQKPAAAAGERLKCPCCPKSFMFKRYLQLHHVRAHGKALEKEVSPTPAPVKNVIGRKRKSHKSWTTRRKPISSNIDLRKQNRSVNSSPDEKVGVPLKTCPECDQVFRSRLRLREHLSLLHPNPPSSNNYKCRHCQRTFIFRKTFRSHMLHCAGKASSGSN